MTAKITPRYSEAHQDRNEQGLSLLREQYENAGVFDCYQRLKDRDTIELVGKDGTVLAILKRPSAIAPDSFGAFATLLCRSLYLGWFMLNELEPETDCPTS